MSNKMLIDATHPEETRVVVLRGNRVEEFDFESASRKQLRGNIYLAKVTRVEPSLQAAFVDYGGNRHGFLAFSEIHPDYYQIPVADRQALLEDERRAHRDEDDNNGGEREQRRGRGRRHRGRGAGRNRNRDVVKSDVVEAQGDLEVTDAQPESDVEAVATGSAAIAADAVDNHAGEPPAPAEATDSAADTLPSEPQSAPAREEQPVADASAEQTAAEAPADQTAADASVEQRAEQASLDEEPTAPAAEPAAEPAVAAQSADAADGVETIGEAEPQALAADAENDGPGDESSAAESDAEESDSDEGDGDSEGEETEHDDEEEDEEPVELVGGDAIEEVMERAPRYRRHYKIQEVIKRRQVMLVQVVKEERGTKGAALTTYLSLAGRYSVLMPNTARGGGISRKVTNAEDRKHMKEIAEELEVPEGMGVILRTAGASRTKLEIKRDFEYLLRLWETVRDLTLKSTAPTLVYEEGSLVKRSIRDLYHKDIDEIVVEGEAAYREAKDFMRMLMPSAVKNVIAYNDTQPIFTRYGIESQLDAMFQPTVQLKSGGYIVINQTEALVAIDVNSGRATREHSIEETATKTNMEAAAEIARQLRLRDLAGLIVIDFIDMDEGRNNRAVERKMKEALKSDRARIQVGRISHFGLLEMSRQRIRSSVLESSTEVCPHCGGTGHVRSVSSVALQLVRAVEETLLKGATHNLIVRSRSDVAIYVLNHKRAHLRRLEERFKISIAVNVDPSLTGHPSFAIDRGEQVMSLDQAKAIAATIRPDSIPAYAQEDEAETDAVLDELEAEGGEDAKSEDSRPSRSRRGRGRGRGRDHDGTPRSEGAKPAPVQAEAGESAEATHADEEEVAEAGEEAESAAAHGDGEKRRRRRGRRGGRRNRRDREDDGAETVAQNAGDEAGQEDTQEAAPDTEHEAAPASDDDAASAPQPDNGQAGPQIFVTPATASETPQGTPAEAAPAVMNGPTAPEPQPERPAGRRSTVREAPPAFASTGEPAYTPPSPPAAPAEVQPPPAQSDASDKPRRSGWWSRRA